MNRREFIGALFGAAAAAAILPRFEFAAAPVPHWCESAVVESLRVGDIFSIEGVNMVNPLTFADTGMLQRFVITANVTADATPQIWPALRADGRFQTVNALPEDNARLITYGWNAPFTPVVHA